MFPRSRPTEIRLNYQSESEREREEGEDVISIVKSLDSERLRLMTTQGRHREEERIRDKRVEDGGENEKYYC